MFDTLIKNPEIFENLQFLEVLPTNEAVDAARHFVGQLYKQKSCTNLDELRYNMTMKTKKSAAELPPTEDAFWQHVLRYVLTYQSEHIAKTELTGVYCKPRFGKAVTFLSWRNLIYFPTVGRSMKMS